MSTPLPPQQFPVTNSATKCWNAVAGSGLIGFENMDQQATIYLGQSSALIAGDLNSVPLAPLGFITLDGSATWYAVAAQATAGPLLVAPSATDFAASPAAIAEAMINVGVAEAIAQAILGTGLPLIPNPVSLYNVSAVAPGGGAQVGFTIPNQAFQQAGCYDAGQSQASADTQMVGILGRPQGGTHPTFTKKFWSTVSDFTLPKNDMQNYGLFGTKVACCHKPFFVAGKPANTNFRTDPSLTAAQRAQANTDYAAIGTFFATLLAAPYNFTTALLTGVPWQEPEVGGNGMSATDYQNVIFTYGAAYNSAGIPLVLDIGSGAGVTTAQAYANAGLAGASAAAVTVGAMAQDLYMPTWLHGNVTPDTIGSIAKAHNLPFGIYEFGCAPGNFGAAGIADAQHYLLGQFASGGNYGILDYMASLQQGGFALADSEYYMGQCTANGAGDLSSPIGLDPTVPAPDFRIAIYQQIFDTLTPVPSQPFTIAANTTKTMPPVNPSPVGSLAPANFLSYEISLELTAGVGSTNPFVAVTLLWFDFDQTAKNQVPVAKEVWHIPMGANGDANGPLVVYGGGRMHGGFMQIKINNQDTVTCTVNNMQVSGTSRIGARSSWFWNPNVNNSPAVPTFTNADAADQSMQIGREFSQTVNAGQNKTWLNGLYCGQATFRCKVVGAAASDVTFELQPVPSGVFNAGTDILHFILGAAGNFEIQPMQIALPRAPTILTVTNNDANPVTIEYLLTAIETS